MVIGATGALGPDVVQILRDRGHAVLGLDIQGSYLLPGVEYRQLDLSDGSATAGFFQELAGVLQASALPLVGVANLATLQTSPVSEAAGSREALTRGVSALLGLPDDVRLFHMSTAEVYGAPPGTPYAEDHHKLPFNAYARMKWDEEQQVIAAHGRETRGGRLWVTAAALLDHLHGQPRRAGRGAGHAQLQRPLHHGGAAPGQRRGAGARSTRPRRSPSGRC